MSTQTNEIVHKLNELIVEAETQVIHAEQDRTRSLLLSENHAAINRRDNWKRALGQLKAARNSIIIATQQEAA